ncbi:hypothetical protein Ancab_029083 [Ancistrocladus abbreviatus]
MSRATTGKEQTHSTSPSNVGNANPSKSMSKAIAQYIVDARLHALLEQQSSSGCRLPEHHLLLPSMNSGAFHSDALCIWMPLWNLFLDHIHIALSILMPSMQSC